MTLLDSNTPDSRLRSPLQKQGYSFPDLLPLGVSVKSIISGLTDVCGRIAPFPEICPLLILWALSRLRL